MIYVLMFPFLTGGREHAYTIPLSVLVGAMGGLLLEAAVRYCNNPTTCTLQRRNWISFGIAFSFVIASGGLFADGCVFIALVWAKSNVGNFSVDVPAFFSWFAVGCITHYYLWWKTKQLRGLAAADKENNDVNGKASSGTPEGDDDDAGDVDEEDIGYDVDAEEEDKKYDEDEENVKKQAVNEELPQETNAAEQDDDEVPSTCALLRGKFRCQCCGCARGTEKSAFQKAGFTIGWTLWVILNCAALYFVVVNIGATHQGEIVNEKLPAVYEEVYRYMDEGPVCAYNGTKYGDMQTFPDKDAAHDAGYLILHCGACGACSDWHNLRLEYTTRNFLAEESAKCARKSLFGGYQDVVDCLSAPEPINFLGKCAECWATDILCTKANCTFIFLQSTMIDAVGNFAVGPDTVTAASCEEAHCEAGQFVPCSGATRRRMNVTSSIARPGAQRCSIVDVDWAELFPE